MCACPRNSYKTAQSTELTPHAEKEARMANALSILLEIWKDEGLRGVGATTYRCFLRTSDRVTNRRMKLAKRIQKTFQWTVAYGPFRGMKLPAEAWWGGAERGAMILGIYEKEVLESLISAPSTHKTFIDLGAADGYYGVGMVFSGRFERCYCFELAARGRRILAECAKSNGVEAKIEILGGADCAFIEHVPIEYRDKSVVLIDVEGAEFELLTESVFSALRGSIIVVELHEWLFDDGARKLQRLRAEAQKDFVVTELRTSARDLSQFPELEALSDDDRWLLCSEGRGRAMRWYRLDPKAPRLGAAEPPEGQS